jgi:probable HAF family extracellular repeat protein
VLTDLGALPGGSASEGNGINDKDQIAGQSLNGKLDPLVGIPEGIAVLWPRDGQIIGLGTLGGNESLAAAVNNRTQVVGGAANAIPDLFPGLLGFWGTQTRAFLWEKGVMRDLGDLGGPDAFAFFVNESGQVAGVSYTSATPDPTATEFCGQDIPPQHPFLWDSGRMIDLGTLGGTCGFFLGIHGLNNRGQVAGGSYLTGDLIYHPFLWDPKTFPHLQDLGTLGGSSGFATELNDEGDVAGGANTKNEESHAFFWRMGEITDIGTIGNDTCSVAHSMNAQGQVVGTSGDCAGTFELHGFLWEKDGPIINLNDFVPSGTDLVITDGESINDRGEIAGSGLLPNGDFHAVVLIPCSNEEGNDDGCRDASEAPDSTMRDRGLVEQGFGRNRHHLTSEDLKQFLAKMHKRNRLP